MTGTGYWVSFLSQFYIITCAHVIKQLQQREIISLRPYNPKLGKLNAEVLWYNPPDENDNNWSAIDDIAVLRLATKLQIDLHPLELDSDTNSLQSCSDRTELCSFGYPTSKGFKGEGFTSLICDQEVGNGFVRIINNGTPIDYGVSGAPLYHVEQNKIIGMIHAKSVSANAQSVYFIPSRYILDILSQLDTTIT